MKIVVYVIMVWNLAKVAFKKMLIRDVNTSVSVQGHI